MERCTSIELMKLTSLKYNYFVVNGNRNEQLPKICCMVGEMPCTKLMGSLRLFCKCESSLG